MEFPETEWTLLFDATLNGGVEGRQALQAFCERYERPVLAFIRARVKNSDVSHDLAQGFWLFLLEHRTWRLADAKRGRFRSFLIEVLRNYLTSELRRRHTQRRGGSAEHVSFDEIELTDGSDVHAAALYDREWAACILDRALTELEVTYQKQSKAAVFEVVRRFLPGAQDVPDAADAAAKIDLTVEALRVEIHRARNRLSLQLRRQIGQTVPPAEVDDELKHLAAAIARSAA